LNSHPGNAYSEAERMTVIKERRKAGASAIGIICVPVFLESHIGVAKEFRCEVIYRLQSSLTSKSHDMYDVRLTVTAAVHDNLTL
jgi:hypothetical protein